MRLRRLTDLQLRVLYRVVDRLDPLRIGPRGDRPRAIQRSFSRALGALKSKGLVDVSWDASSGYPTIYVPTPAGSSEVEKRRLKEDRCPGS